MGKNFEADSPCTACGYYAESSVCYHHLHSQKSHPELKYEKWNQMPLCLRCHNQVHQWGLKSFSEKYRNVKSWLERNGWEVNFQGKWCKPRNE